MIRPLPITVRPRSGESAESYIGRLAEANHLRPSYLHGYLCGPPNYLGRLQPERLAALSRRPLPVLQRTLTRLIPQRRRPRPARPPQPSSRAEAKAALFTQIRRGRQEEGLSIRALADKHRVHRRTIRQALTSPQPPSRKPTIRNPPILGPLHEVIDAVLDDELAAHPGRQPTARRIWERLLDEHHAEISYATVTDYLGGRRPAAIR